jgi:hypothetical protein
MRRLEVLLMAVFSAGLGASKEWFRSWRMTTGEGVRV